MSARCAQCYLKDTAERLEADIARAAAEGWAFAAKTVRGAYLVFERARAAALGAASPVQDTLADTHANYDRRDPLSSTLGSGSHALGHPSSWVDAELVCGAHLMMTSGRHITGVDLHCMIEVRSEAP